MIAIVDYGVGNLFSLKCSFEAVGADVQVTGDAEVLRQASHIVLPGVGAFGDAAAKLRATGLDAALKDAAASGTPLLGICLGMQLLFERSFEYGEHEGLGLIPGEVRPLEGAIDSTLNIPHIGWNALEFAETAEGGPSALFGAIDEGSYVYFVHSYYATGCERHTIATVEYDIPVTAAVRRDNVIGCQFHPEKSGEVGLAILRAFCAMEGAAC